jgi:hypothetical protein
MASLLDKLKSAVIKQLGGKRIANESFPDISKYGIQGGFSGFIYYTETEKFFNANRATIVGYLQEYAEGCGCEIVDLIKCDDEEETRDVKRVLNGIKFKDDYYAKNKLAWAAAEIVAYEVCNNL